MAGGEIGWKTTRRYNKKECPIDWKIPCERCNQFKNGVCSLGALVRPSTPKVNEK